MCICMIMTLGLVEKMRISPNDRFYVKFTVCKHPCGKEFTPF